MSKRLPPSTRTILVGTPLLPVGKSCRQFVPGNDRPERYFVTWSPVFRAVAGRGGGVSGNLLIPTPPEGSSLYSSSRAFSVAQAKSVGGLAEPAGEVVVQVLLIVADPGDVAVGA